MSVAEATAMDLELLGETRSPQKLHGNGFESIEVDGLGARAITRGKNRILWDLSNGQRLDGDWVRLHPDGVRGLRVDPEGVALCDLSSGERRCVLEGAHADAPPALGFGDLALGPAHRDPRETDVPMTPRVWSLVTGKKLHDLAEPALAAAVIPGDRALIIGPRGGASLWDLASGERIATMKAPVDRPLKLRVGADGKRAVTLGKKGITCVWDLDAGKLAGSSDAMHAEYGGGGRDHFELAADGRSALFASRPGSYGDHFIGAMDLASGALDLSWTTADEEREITGFAPFPASSHLALLVARSARQPRTLEIWDLEHRVLVAANPSPSARLIAATPNGRVVIAGNTMSGDSFFQVYRAFEGQGPLPEQPLPGAHRAAPPVDAPVQPAAEPAKKRRKSPAR